MLKRLYIVIAVTGVILGVGVTACLAQSIETAVVDIKAVDAQTLQDDNGKVAVGALQRSGQGIVIDPSGIIATNRHIVGANPQHIYVRLADGQVFEAVIIQNSRDDLALIKIKTPLPLRAITLGDSSQLQIGNTVLALANSNLNPQRKLRGEIVQLYTEVATNTVAILQVSIPLHPGDSGGPIINEDGLLMGLIMANQISDKTKSYAIASNKIQQEYLKYKNTVLISRL